MVAVEAALSVLNWMENLEDHEMPPERIWGNGEWLEYHFHMLKERRKNPGEELEAIPPAGMPIAGMSSNELAKPYAR